MRSPLKNPFGKANWGVRLARQMKYQGRAPVAPSTSRNHAAAIALLIAVILILWVIAIINEIFK